MKKIMLFLLFCTTLFAQEFALKKVYSIADSKNFYLGSIGQCVKFNNKLYISDLKNATIFEFNQDGKLIRNIGRKGGGPGEFLDAPTYMFVKGDTLLVLDNYMAECTINYFNKNMKFVKAVRFKSWIRTMAYLNNCFYIVGYPNSEILLKQPLFSKNDINFKNRTKINLPGEDINPIRNGLSISSSKTNYFILTYKHKNKIQIYKDGMYVKEFSVPELPKETPNVINKVMLEMNKNKRSKREAELLSTDITEQIFSEGVLDEQNRIFLQPRKKYTNNKPTILVYNINGDKLGAITFDQDEIILYVDKDEMYTASNMYTKLNKYQIVKM